MSSTYVTKVNGNFLAASEVVPNSPLASKLASLVSGAFEVVSLNGSGKPDVANPSTKIIYLTKSETAGLTDPYTEWIYTGTDGEAAVASKWEIIGETTMDLSNYKTKQTAKNDPTASGTTITAIDTITQNANGEITATKKTIRSGTTSQTGVVQLEDSTSSTSTTKAATPNSVKSAYDLAAGKATKPSNPTSGNLAKLDANGDLVDSGIAATNVKTKQTAKTDPTASGNALSFIDSITQNANGEITATKKTVTDMTGADGTNAGTHGLVPAPSATDNNKFLRGDGTWQTVVTSDTKVKATAKTDNVNYKILATASASPTSGAATEAVYDADITLNPSTNTIAANISGNAATATTAKDYNTSTGTIKTALESKANASEAVTGIAYDSTEKAITQTINGTTTNAIAAGDLPYVRHDINNQGLSTTEKSNARTNIGAGTSNLALGTSSTTAAAGDHAHGSITNGGAITATGVALATGDSLVFVDSSDSSKIKKTSITFDGSTTTKALTQKGTFETVLTDASAFATAAQGTKADSAIQGVKSNGTALTPDANNVVDIPVAATSTYGVVTVETATI